MESDEEFAGRRVGRSIDQFRLDRVLGVGGMAAVYAARAADGSQVAVKVLHPDVGVRGDVRERFFREGFIANHLGHPAVVRALGYGDAGPDGAYLVLELLEGETLSARVRRHGTLPPGELLGYADEILDALALAHASGIVHRDLKPENLFVTREGRIKILDFGLARVHDALPRDHRTRSGIALGTFPYMAPEQALGRHAEIDGRTDLFALGATLFRLISGRKIHEAASEAELLMAMASKPAPSLAEVAPATPLPVVQLVDLALAYGKDARYPDARTMQSDVRALRAGLAPPYAAQRFAEREQKTRAEPLSSPVSSSPHSGNFAPPSASASLSPPNLVSAPRKGKAAWPWVVAALSGLVALGSAGAFLLRGEPPLAASASPPSVALAEPRPAQPTTRNTAEATSEPGAAVARERAPAATELRRRPGTAARAQAAAASSSAAPVAPALLAAPNPAAPGALETAAAGGTTAAALAADTATAPTAAPESKLEAAPAVASAPAPLPALRKRRPRRPIDFGD